jgi:hypothetical protein
MTPQPRSPNLNWYAERFVRSITESCLERMILFGEDALGSPLASSLLILTASETIKASVSCLFSRTLVARSAPDQFDAEAASPECSIVMIGPPDDVRIRVFGYYAVAAMCTTTVKVDRTLRPRRRVPCRAV